MVARIKEAAVKTVLLAVLVHLCVYTAIWLTEKSPRGFLIFNFFNMLDLEVFFPQLVEGVCNFCLSYLSLLGAFLVILFRFTERRDEETENRGEHTERRDETTHNGRDDRPGE